MNSNAFTVALIGMFVALINEVSLSLGLTTQVWASPETITEIADEGFLEGLLSFARWGVNNAGAFLQLVTFQADVPLIINTLLLAPFGLMIWYIVFVMIRGGAS